MLLSMLTSGVTPIPPADQHHGAVVLRDVDRECAGRRSRPEIIQQFSEREIDVPFDRRRSFWHLVNPEALSLASHD